MREGEKFILCFSIIFLVIVHSQSNNMSREEEDDCKCVPYYLCSNGHILSVDITGILALGKRSVEDKKFKRNNTCSHYIDICCNKTSTKPWLINSSREIGCGIRNRKGIGFRITGNSQNETQFGEFPWMIIILIKKIVKGQTIYAYKCGGSLIHKMVVLTAAHCVTRLKAETLLVRGGEWDSQTTKEIYPYVEKQIKKVIVHKSYHPGGLFNDIALLILDEPFDTLEYLDVVCLPFQKQEKIEKECIATGWGKEAFDDKGRYATILKSVELAIVPRNKCQEALRETRLEHNFILHESFICAGGVKGVDTCTGDGGGPLVCPVRYGEEIRYLQVGIVSWGVGCGTTTPALYVDVTKFLDWIEIQLRDNGININHMYIM